MKVISGFGALKHTDVPPAIVAVVRGLIITDTVCVFWQVVALKV